MKIALGTANFGQKYGLTRKNINSNKEIEKILKFSNKSIIKLIDTSDNYGSSEMLLGNNNLKSFKIITKLKISVNEKKSDNLENIVFKKIEDSLSKLNIKKLYAILLHNSDDLKGDKKHKLIKVLKKLKKKTLSLRLEFQSMIQKNLILYGLFGNLILCNAPSILWIKEFMKVDG